MKEIQNPHDAFFKRSFDFPQVRRDFCRCYLPKELIPQLNLDKLEVQSASFVDEKLRQRHSDLLLQTVLKSGGEAWVYLLFEHQSHPEPDMPFRLLRYLVRIWEHHRAQHGQAPPLPLIVPLVLYHGDTPWTVSDFFSHCLSFQGDAGIQVTEMQYLVVDLSKISDHDIMERINARIGKGLELLSNLVVLKHIRDADFVEFFESLIPLLDELAERTTGLQYIETLLRYVYHTRNKQERDDLMNLLDRAKPVVKEAAMTTIAQSIHEEGRREGRQEGRLDTLREILREDLQDRFGPIPDALKERLSEIQSYDTLLTLWRKSKKCQTLDGFEALLEKDPA